MTVHAPNQALWMPICCDFIATIPLGILADKYGPKPVMLLNISGLILSWAWVLVVCLFPHVFRSEMILLASAFCILGGATHFNTAIIYSEAAIYTKDRTTTFSMLEICIQIGQLIGPVVGSALLLRDVYSPFYFVFPISLLSIIFVLLLPSGGRNGHTKENRKPADHWSPTAHRDELESLLSGEITAQAEGTRGFSVKDTITTAVFELRRSWSLFTGYRVIQYGYAASLVVTLGKQALHILLQYVSKRFGISIAKAGFLFSIKAIAVMVLDLISLPGAQRMLHGTQARITIKIARVSISLLAVGITMMGLAWNIGVLIPGLITYALGFGFPIAVRSLLSSLASTKDLPIPIIFSGMAIAETVGSFIGATVLTGAFTKTIDLQGLAQGIPFLVCAVFYVVILVPTWFVNLESEVKRTTPPSSTVGGEEDGHR